MGAVFFHRRTGDLLQFADGVDALLFNRILLVRIAVGHLSRRLGRHVHRFHYQEKS